MNVVQGEFGQALQGRDYATVIANQRRLEEQFSVFQIAALTRFDRLDASMQTIYP